MLVSGVNCLLRPRGISVGNRCLLNPRHQIGFEERKIYCTEEDIFLEKERGGGGGQAL